MKKQFNRLTCAIFALLATQSAQAIQFDGFMTAGASIHDSGSNVYVGSLGDRGITDNLSFETDTRFGLQISSDISDNMSVVAQLLGTGVSGNFNATIEWAYIDYAINDIASIHVGKIKQPVYLVNDYVEVGYAYPWIRPPGEVYYLNNPLNTINGIEALLQFPVGKGTLSFQPYFGSNRDDIPNAGGAYFEADNIYGMDVKYSGKGYTVHASDFHCNRVKTTGQLNNVPAGPLGNVNINLNGVGECNVGAVGFNLDMSNIVVYAEWQKRTTTDELSRAFGDQTGWYTTLGYRIGKWLPHLTFASIDGTASTFGLNNGQGAITGSNPQGPPNLPPNASLNFPVAIQTSVTAGLRYEVNDSAALKVEYQLVNVETDQGKLAAANEPGGGTAPNGQKVPYVNYGLFNADFSGFPGNLPTKNVGIFSVALDVIF